MFGSPALVFTTLMAAAFLAVAAEEASGGPAAASVSASGVEGFREFPLATGRLFVPTNAIAGGSAVDLLVHFHGHPPVVCSNALAAGLSIPVVIVNFKGLSSSYAAPFRDPAVWPALLDDVHAVLGRHLQRPIRQRRLTVSSFSAGYGAVRELLQQPGNARRINTLILADSLYAGYVGPEGEQRPDPRQMEPFVQFARRALSGDVRMIVTHSQQVPEGYASTRETAEVLIEAAGARREPPGERTAWMPENVARRGDFIVRAYPGSSPRDHMEHLRRLADALRAVAAEGHAR